MYVRKVKGGKATFFQIGQKVKGKFVLSKHVDSASSPKQIEILQLKAQGKLEKMKLDLKRYRSILMYSSKFSQFLIKSKKLCIIFLY